MFGGKKILHKGFARLSPVFVALGSVLTVGAAAPGKTAAEAAATAAVRRQSASMQFARAEEQRAALNGKATEKRTLLKFPIRYWQWRNFTPRWATGLGEATTSRPPIPTNSWCANIRQAGIARMRPYERRSCSAISWEMQRWRKKLMEIS